MPATCIIYNTDVGTRRYTIKQLPPELRPRERLLSEGPEALSSAELLAILLGTVDLVVACALGPTAGLPGAVGSKPVRCLVGSVHRLLVLPQRYREHLTALPVAE